jgi:hypothetical protein
MNEEHLAALRKWGEGLRLDGRDEVRAAGKAIVLLCEEVERLEIALWSAQAATPPSEVWQSSHADEQPAEEEADPDATTALRTRLRRLLGTTFER